MIKIIEVDRGDVLAFRVEGRIERADIDVLGEEVTSRLKKYERIRAYVEAGEITGISWDAFAADLAFAFTHVWDVERKAVVSEDKWHKMFLEFADQLFPSVEARHFQLAERALALEWIQDGPDARALFVQALDHVETLVPDLDAGVDWMRRCFGLREVEAFDEVGTEGGPVMLSADDSYTKVALVRGDPAGFTDGVGHRVVAFRTDARAFLRFVEYAHEVPVHGEDGQPISPGTPLDTQDHGISISVYFRDPWGNSFEVTTYEVEAVRAGLA